MSRTYRSLGRLPSELIHAIVAELGYERHCDWVARPRRRNRHLHPDDCARGATPYPWEVRGALISDATFAACLRRRGWSESAVRAYFGFTFGKWRWGREPKSDRQFANRAYRRHARALVHLGRENDIRRWRPDRGWDRW
jgi:hypothetical protein